nr:hypothetical protein [Candidatus Freyarchaeota archaeon]
MVASEKFDAQAPGPAGQNSEELIETTLTEPSRQHVKVLSISKSELEFATLTHEGEKWILAIRRVKVLRRERWPKNARGIDKEKQKNVDYILKDETILRLESGKELTWNQIEKLFSSLRDAPNTQPLTFSNPAKSTDRQNIRLGEALSVHEEQEGVPHGGSDKRVD